MRHQKQDTRDVLKRIGWERVLVNRLKKRRKSWSNYVAFSDELWRGKRRVKRKEKNKSRSVE